MFFLESRARLFFWSFVRSVSGSREASRSLYGGPGRHQAMPASKMTLAGFYAHGFPLTEAQRGEGSHKPQTLQSILDALQERRSCWVYKISALATLGRFRAVLTLFERDARAGQTHWPPSFFRAKSIYPAHPQTYAAAWLGWPKCVFAQTALHLPSSVAY